LGEELVLKQMTTGASNDFERATKLARNMVTMWGMSESMGPMVYGDRDEEIFLGREVTRHQNVSEDTARAIDGEVRRLIDTNYARAKKILTDHMDQLHYLAEALIEYETLEDDEIDQIMAGKKLHREVPPEKPHAPPPSPSATAPTTPVKVDGKEASQES
jgi:cell division protease FtsH